MEPAGMHMGIGQWAVYTVNKLFNIQFSIAKGHNQKLVKKLYLNNNNNSNCILNKQLTPVILQNMK